jgi:photosystem II stability/assembly factor-like uncharacterized protein
LTAVHFPDPRRGWAVGHDGKIVVSIDRGDSWVLQRDGLAEQRDRDRHRLDALAEEQAGIRGELVQAANQQTRIQLQRRLEALALEREDLEFTLAQPVFAPPLLDVYFSDELRGVAVGAFNTLLVTDDGGIRWRTESHRLDNPDGMHLNAVTGDGQGTYWVAAEGGLLFRSRDGARTWQRLSSPRDASWFGIARSPRSGVLLAFGLQGSVYRSADGGDSWQPVDTGVQRSIGGGVFLSDDFAVLVGAVGTMLLSDDGGGSFRRSPLARRVGLSAVAGIGGRLVAVGQGGVHLRDSLEDWL